MPRRPRSHQLETESRNAFRHVLPSQWVCRDVDQDYGVDCEVELFDADTKATGKRFLVQLKATDKEPRPPRIRLTSEVLEYYEKSVLPVLLVRYGATRKELHARWCHSIDPYYEKPSASGLTVKFAESDLLTAESVQRLAAEATAYLSLREASPATPVHFDLRIASDPVQGVKRFRLYADLRDLTLKVPSTLDVSLEVSRAQKPLNLITIDSDKIEVKLAGMHGCTLHTTQRSPAERENLGYDIILLVALAFSRLGQPARAATLIEIAWPHSNLITQKELSFRVALALIKAGKGNRLVDYARLLLDASNDEHLEIASELLTFTYFDFNAEVNEARAEAMEQLAAIMVSKDHRPQAAALHYNIGRANIGKPTGDLRKALHHYRLAQVYDPAYCKRAYYCRELAGALFMLRRYILSAHFYEAAFAIDADRTTLPRLADAYMFCGEYKLAQSTLEKYFTGEPRPEDSTSKLQLLALEVIQEKAASASQKRCRATHSLDPATATESELQAHYEESIAKDALDGFAWVNLGRQLYRQGDLQGALARTLVAVAIVPRDAESWANVLGIARKLGEDTIFGLATAAAHQCVGAEIFEYLPDMGTAGDELLVHLERLHAPELTTTIRFPQPDGAIATATLRHSHSDDAD